MKTSREKYDAFRALYGEMRSAEHRRFDKLVRLLLDLPESDEPAFKVGDFVYYGASREVFRVVGVLYDGAPLTAWVTIRDDRGRDYRRRFAEVSLVPAFNGPVDEMPF